MLLARAEALSAERRLQRDMPGFKAEGRYEVMVGGGKEGLVNYWVYHSEEYEGTEMEKGWGRDVVVMSAMADVLERCHPYKKLMITYFPMEVAPFGFSAKRQFPHTISLFELFFDINKARERPGRVSFYDKPVFNLPTPFNLNMYN